MKLIQEIGSYAGFAAVVGLAVLSALYFSQARDVRRLRDWAGRAPERDADARARVAAAPNSVSPAQPVGANSGNSVGKASTPAGAGAAAASAGAAAAAGGGRGGIVAPPRPTARPSGSTQILGAHNSLPEERWYRRLAPRYVALIVAGVLVIGGGITVGVLQLLGNGGGTQAAGTGNSGGVSGGGDAGKSPKPKPPVVRPADVRVAVFNGTLVSGLGKQYGEKVKSLGFPGPSVNQAPEAGQKAESVVFYAPGKKPKAQLVRKKLKISNIEPLDDVFSPLAGNAEVVVVVGANATP